MLSHQLTWAYTLFFASISSTIHAENFSDILPPIAPEIVAKTEIAEQAKVIVDTSKAEICLSDTEQCFPALIGTQTPFGSYHLTLHKTDEKGYGGDVLGFKIEPPYLFALHRVWLGKPSEHRLERIRSKNPARRTITNGCINVENDVYDLIKSKGYKTITIL